MQSTEPEIWKPVEGFESLYEVSTLGRVRSLSRHGRAGRVLTPMFSQANGYESVALYKDGVRTARKVHRLVAQAFVDGGVNSGRMVLHGDGDSRNNRASNLRWGDQAANMHDAVKHGTHPQSSKDFCPQGHAYTAENTYRDSRGRSCRQCRAARDAEKPRRGNFNGAKTRCPRGHEYDAANTAYRPSGGRYCRTCNRDRARRIRRI